MSGVTHTFKQTISVPGLPTMPADPAVVVTADYCTEIEIDVAAGTVSQELDVPTITKSKVVSLVINADKAAMNVFTNAAAGSGGQEFVLAKNASVVWNNQMNTTLFPNPISTSTITKFYLNNPGTVTGTFRASFLQNL